MNISLVYEEASSASGIFSSIWSQISCLSLVILRIPFLDTRDCVPLTLHSIPGISSASILTRPSQVVIPCCSRPFRISCVFFLGSMSLINSASFSCRVGSFLFLMPMSPDDFVSSGFGSSSLFYDLNNNRCTARMHNIAAYN